MEETSAPSAPKAPLNALNLAVPLSDSDEYLIASSILCAFKFEIEIKATNKKNNLCIIELGLYYFRPPLLPLPPRDPPPRDPPP